MSDFLGWIDAAAGMSPQLRARLLQSALGVLLLWGLHRLILHLRARRSVDPASLYRWRKTSSYVTFGIGVVLIGRIWFVGIQSLSTYLGLLSAGLAIALRDPIVNLAGWAFILWRRPFEVGDRVQIGDHRGDVIDQRIFQFTLMEVGNWVDADQSTGRIIHIPNGAVFTQVQANYSKGFQYIWDEVPVLITFESHWQEAKQIIGEIAALHAEHLSGAAEKRLRRAVHRFMISYGNLTPIVYTSVRDCGVLLTARYLCEPRQRRSVQEKIWEDVLVAFAARDDIDFAYPTTRFYDNASEGKPGHGPSTPQ